MKRIAILFALCASLSACGASTVNSISAQAVVSADAAYTAASIAGEEAVKLGALDKAKFQTLDNEAYQILLKIRLGQATVADLTAITNQMTGGK